MSSSVKSRHYYWQTFGLIFLCFLVGQGLLVITRVLHENTANKHWNSRRYQARKSNPYNTRLVDSCVSLLQTGDLVVRRGDDMTSYMLSRLNKREDKYSHCGIAVIEAGVPYIYHSIGGEDNPDEKMRKESAEYWFSPANNLAFGIYRYDMSDSRISSLIHHIDSLYQSGVMFDMDFDMSTDERLYCSEMIYKSVLAATQDSAYLQIENGYGRLFTGVDNLYLSPHAKRVCQIKFK